MKEGYVIVTSLAVVINCPSLYLRVHFSLSPDSSASLTKKLPHGELTLGLWAPTVSVDTASCVLDSPIQSLSFG